MPGTVLSASRALLHLSGSLAKQLTQSIERVFTCFGNWVLDPEKQLEPLLHLHFTHKNTLW